MNFQILEYKSTHAIPNLGTIFFIFLSFLLLIPISCCMTCWAHDIRELRKYDYELKDFLCFTGTVRFLMESYMELMLAVTMTVASYDPDTGYVGVTFSNYFAITFFVLTVGLPIWIILFFLCKVNMWNDERFQKKWGTVIEGMRTEYNSKEQGKTWIAILYPVLMLVRRIGFVFSIIFYPEFTWL